MSNRVIEGLKAAVIAAVGVAVIAIVLGFDEAIVSNLLAAVVELIVIAGVIGMVASVAYNLVEEAV